MPETSDTKSPILVRYFHFIPPKTRKRDTDKRTDACCSRPLCTYTQIWIPQQPSKNEFFHVFGVKKNQKKIYKKGIMHLFKIFLDPENMKKTPLKVAHNWPRPFFSVLARLPKRPKNRNPVPPKVP